MASVTPSARDVQLLARIQKYCEKIILFIRDTHGLDEFLDDPKTQDAVILDLEQIGELTKLLSGEFTASHRHIPWKSICRARDRYVHHYEDTDMDIVWETVTVDIPLLIAFCDNLFR